MTEAEWLVCGDPRRLLKVWQGKSSDRKYRLFAVACSRLVLALLDPMVPRWLDVAEQYAEGLADERALSRARGSCYLATRRNAYWAAWDTLRETARIAAYRATVKRDGHAWARTRPTDPEREPARVALIRCVFGNPFRAAACDLRRQTPDVVALARQAYESRDFSALPILADALEDAGCTDTTILDHCRSGGPHVRGCWVVDRVLGKS
jgi:hypothetical protein